MQTMEIKYSKLTTNRRNMNYVSMQTSDDMIPCSIMHIIKAYSCDTVKLKNFSERGNYCTQKAKNVSVPYNIH